MPTGFVWRRFGSSERLSSPMVNGMAPCPLGWVAFAGLMPGHQLQELHSSPLHPLLENLTETSWGNLQQQLQSEKFCFSASEALRALSSRSLQQYSASPAWRKVMLIQMCLSVLAALPAFGAPGWVWMETPALGAEPS